MERGVDSEGGKWLGRKGKGGKEGKGREGIVGCGLWVGCGSMGNSRVWFCMCMSRVY